MTLFEKIFAVFAILFAVALMTVLVIIPESREMGILLPLSFIGLIINIGLMFVVFKDIFTRGTLNRNQKVIWTAVLLLFWPAILLYLPLHGFRKRS